MIFLTYLYISDSCLLFKNPYKPKRFKLVSRALWYSLVMTHSTHHFNMSADVTFFEDTSYFTSRIWLHLLGFTNPYFDPQVFLLPISKMSKPPSQSMSSLPHQFLNYHRQSQHEILEVVISLDSCDSSLTALSPLATSLPKPFVDLPLALHKGIHCTHDPHPIYNFLIYHHLSSANYAFISAFLSITTQNFSLSHLGWHQAMINEMTTLDLNILLFSLS